MFTGIVQGIATVTDITDKPQFRSITVRLPQGTEQHLQQGASIANNGCCLTITKIDGSHVSFDIMQESLKKTNLGLLTIGSGVNIERSAKLGDEIGGHLVSGHIMQTTTIRKIIKTDTQCTMWFDLPAPLKPYLFHKGFIALDGCSLTIGEITDDAFSIYFIPETLNKTLFGQRQEGDIINLEIDTRTQTIVDTVRHILATTILEPQP